MTRYKPQCHHEKKQYYLHTREKHRVIAGVIAPAAADIFVPALRDHFPVQPVQWGSRTLMAV